MEGRRGFSKRVVTSGLIFFLGASFQSQTASSYLVHGLPTSASNPLPNYQIWDEAVQKYVQKGSLGGISTNEVDYAGLEAGNELDLFIQSLEDVDTSKMNRNEVLALYINAYNALAIKMVIENRCRRSFLGGCSLISSIKDIGSVFESVWKRKAGRIGGEVLSLDEVEDKLRFPKNFPENPLIHACIVCASISCPNLATKAYFPQSIDADMTKNMEDFLSNEDKGLFLDKDNYQAF